MAAVDAIALALRHDIPQWLPTAYAELCKRPQPLGDGEAKMLGSSVTARIARAREILREDAFRTFYRKHFSSRFSIGLDDELVARVVQQTIFSLD